VEEKIEVRAAAMAVRAAMEEKSPRTYP